MKKIFSIEDFIGDDEAFHYYTGLENYSIFKLLLDILGPAVNSLNYFNGPKPNLSSENILFLVLIHLRRYKTIFELGLLFAVDKSQVTNCFVTWVNLMYYTFKELNWWPEKELVRFYMPSDFKSKFPSTRVILDGTECPIQKPSQPLAQQTTFSSYKSRNTFKTVIGSTPGGLVTYVSPCYGGATSDRQIIERGKLPQMCDSGDSVMVDKGFNVDDLFVPNKVSVNIPAFFKKQNRMSHDTVMKDRKIASKRAHIERVIGLGKSFKILTNPLNNTESSMGTKILTVCFYLCNFRKCIVSKSA